jgi:hypothetical protein
MFADHHVDDNNGELNIAVHRLQRVKTILDVLVHQMDIMETMTPLDFLDFRDMLRPASGFQSMQFKILEARLGLRMEARFGKQYYTSQLKPEHKAEIEALEKLPTLLELVNAWLERMPFLEAKYWPQGEATFFQQLERIYDASLGAGRGGQCRAVAQDLRGRQPERKLSPKRLPQRALHHALPRRAHLPAALPLPGGLAGHRRGHGRVARATHEHGAPHDRPARGHRRQHGQGLPARGHGQPLHLQRESPT